MTAYITTPEQHAQIVDALETARTTAMDNVMAARIPECGDFAAIAQNLDWSVATLKAMKPVEHIAELMWDEEKQKSYMQCMMPIGLLLEGSKLYAGDKPPQVGLD